MSTPRDRSKRDWFDVQITLALNEIQRNRILTPLQKLRAYRRLLKAIEQ